MKKIKFFFSKILTLLSLKNKTGNISASSFSVVEAKKEIIDMINISKQFGEGVFNLVIQSKEGDVFVYNNKKIQMLNKTLILTVIAICFLSDLL
jgi:hypothetical protein